MSQTVAGGASMVTSVSITKLVGVVLVTPAVAGVAADSAMAVRMGHRGLASKVRINPPLQGGGGSLQS
ncbi:hypothetical protein [uncultured Sphingomonas sp.]|uniref:hypothetical protein n=1 Tax=uncultured Sphingomonas sp. TaxID=158754 RepID=UPI0037499251